MTFRARLAAGNNPLAGSRILVARGAAPTPKTAAEHVGAPLGKPAPRKAAA